jgi:hypothetical protein
LAQRTTGWERAKQDEELAPKLLSIAFALSLKALPGYTQHNSGLLTSSIRELLGGMARTSQIRDRISFDLADDACQRMHGSADRVAQLLELVLDREHDERTASFLARAGRLYVYGFEPEVLVMCGAALDVALQEVMSDERMTDAGYAKRVTPRRDALDYTLNERIDAAAKLRLISYAQKQRAHKLRRARNNAVHVAPVFMEDGISNALAAISETTELLDSIFGARS